MSAAPVRCSVKFRQSFRSCEIRTLDGRIWPENHTDNTNKKPLHSCRPCDSLALFTVSQTGTGDSFQISFAYWVMVRSLENLPIRAVFKIAIFAQRALSLKAASTSL